MSWFIQLLLFTPFVGGVFVPFDGSHTSEVTLFAGGELWTSTSGRVRDDELPLGKPLEFAADSQGFPLVRLSRDELLVVRSRTLLVAKPDSTVAYSPESHGEIPRRAFTGHRLSTFLSAHPEFRFVAAVPTDATIVEVAEGAKRVTVVQLNFEMTLLEIESGRSETNARRVKTSDGGRVLAITDQRSAALLDGGRLIVHAATRSFPNGELDSCSIVEDRNLDLIEGHGLVERALVEVDLSNAVATPILVVREVVESRADMVPTFGQLASDGQSVYVRWRNNVIVLSRSTWSGASNECLRRGVLRRGQS